MNAINDFAMTDGYDWNLVTDDNGFFDIDPICNHEVVSGLIYLRLINEIDWDLLRRAELSNEIKLQIVRLVVIQTYGVTSVDMSGFNPSFVDGNFNLGSICPTIDCANSVECVPL